MADVVVFGTGDYAAQADFYLHRDSPHRVVAFSLTADFIEKETFLGRPVIAFEQIGTAFPPERNSFFLPMSSRKMNTNRERFFNQAREKGYDIISYVSTGCVNHAAHIGANCFILERTNIQPFVQIGDNCIVWSGTHIGHHSLIGDHNFISGNVCISGRCRVGANCHVSAGAIVDAGVSLAQGTLLGLGGVAVRDTEPWTIHTGNPARRRRVPSLDLDFL